MAITPGYIIKRVVRLLSIIGLLLILSLRISAQSTIGAYTVKKGRMFIELNKKSDEASIDSFITQYDLENLELKRFIRSNFHDSLLSNGWKIESNDKNLLVISKALNSLDKINQPAEKILFTEKGLSLAERFPPISSNVLYGYNRFKNKHPFAVRDSIVTFFLRDHQEARRVMLAGSFNSWEPGALSMQKTDSGWIAHVKLGIGKYWYKFIIDGRWDVDRDNQWTENDGLGNNNSVYFKTNFVFKVSAFNSARKVSVAGSFNTWRPNELLMNPTHDGWELPVYLANGTHTYRYVVDGKWFADPQNPDKLPNEFNDINSVVRLGGPHVFFLQGFDNAKQVVLTGSFNKWRKDELYMRKTDRGWELPYQLGPGNHQYRFIVDSKWVSQAEAISTSGNSFFVIDANYTFRLKGFANAKRVYLAGDFNEWSPDTFAMEKEGDEWVLKVYLAPGKHLYKFVVDGRWIRDPGNKLWEQNEHNTGNSVLWVDKNRVM